MAIRAIVLKKKITDAKKDLETLRANRETLANRADELKKRESEIVSAVDEVSNEEEQKAVEELAAAYDADKSEFDNDVNENETKISDMEKAVEDMERELSEIESEQTRTVPPPPEKSDEQTTTKSKKKTGGKRTMFKTRSIRMMNYAEREELITRDETKEFLAEIRAAVMEKRALSGGNYLIPRTITDLIREDIIEYSKLYKHCRVRSLSGDGRVIIMGTSAEAFWEECCDPIYELEKSINKVDIDCFKVAGFIPLCNALIEDSDIDLLDEIMVSILQGIGLALDKAILYGTGVKMPTGVVTAIDDDETLKVTNEVTIAAASSTGVDLFKSLVKAGAKAANNYARGEKTWTMNEATYTTLKAEALSVNAAGAIVSGIDGTMPVAGGTIEVLNFIPDENIVAGYFDLYVLGERKGMTIDTSEHVRFIQDQTVVRGRARYDGKPAIPGAFVVIGINGTDPSVSVDFANPSEG